MKKMKKWLPLAGLFMIAAFLFQAKAQVSAESTKESTIADGVHIGQSDMEYRKAREILGEDKIIGLSAGNLQEAIDAEKMGADYIGVGAVFHTDTKKDTTAMSFEKLKEITDTVSIPVVAIGGISADNLMQLAGTGIDGISVISAIFGQEDPGAATKKLVELTREMLSK